MLILDQLKKGDQPLRALALAVLGGVGVLLIGLWYVQVFSARKYQQSLETQSYRTVRVPALRGRILDRNRQPLAENQPRFRLDLYLDELRPQFEAEFTRERTNLLAERRLKAGLAEPGFFSRLFAHFHRGAPRVGLSKEDRERLARTSRFVVVSNIVEQTAQQIGQPLTLSDQALYLHHRDRLALPLALVSNATPAQLARFSERAWALPAVNLEIQPLRYYPHGRTAAHLIGHLTRDDRFYDDEAAAYNYHLPDFYGRIGLEHMFDHELRGVAGARSILVNSAGYRQRQGETEILPSQPGQNLVLTIDLGLQIAAEKALATVSAEPRGAVVVMDPRNGDVLALASAPSFDPNEFVPAITPSNWGRLTNELLRPMLNRATYGAYNPGSTFKIVTGLALLEAGLDPRSLTKVEADPATPGKSWVHVGNRPIKDTAPPGDYDFRRAFIKSSNSYFIQNGLNAGLKRVLEMGHRFRLGETTGLKISQEVAGDFPELADVTGRWNDGNVANVCIGQEITVTPIQMAVLVSAVANGGRVYWPRLVDRLEPVDFAARESPVSVRVGQLRSELHVKPENLDIVRAAMRDDVADDGSGKEARIPGFAVCGKTGTAEIKQGTHVIDQTTWFVSFAPYESPRYVVIVMVESGGSGGRTCAPVARRIYEYLHQRETTPPASVARN